LNNYSVPSGDLREVNLKYASEINRVLEVGSFIGGDFVSDFENRLSNYLGSNYVISVASGMDALILSLSSLGLPPKSRVLVANNAGGYASLAAISAGFEPVYCDIEPSGFLLDTNELNKWNGQVKAIIATHLYGKMLDMSIISKWAQENEVRIIEDCAQAIGALQNGKRAGTFGEVGCFSFYPSKNLGGIGDGGAISTSDPEIAERLRKLANYGWGSRYKIDLAGGRNSRLDAVNAVVLSGKLPNLDENNGTRRRILSRYIEEFKNYSFMIDKNATDSHVGHLASGRVANPEGFIEFCKNRGVQVSRHYPHLDSDQRGLFAGEAEVNTPFAAGHCAEVVNLPIYPGLQEKQVDKVISTVLAWHERDK